MSSRILQSGIVAMPWRAAPPGSSPEAGSEYGNEASQDPTRGGQSTVHPVTEQSPAGHHHPSDETRIRELEERVKLLEGRIEDEKRAAREQGLQQGRAEGIQSGIQQEAAKWTDALGRLTRALEEMSKMKARFRTEVEEDAVKLALAIGRKVLHRELASDPEALVGLTRVALGKLNIRELQRVRIHPADAPAIEKMLSASSVPKRVEVVADGTLERGGAIFETERGLLDASVTTQLSEIERGLTDMLAGSSK